MTSLIGANMADIPDPLEWTTRLDLDPSWDEPVVKKDLLVLALRLDQRFNRIDVRFERIEGRLDGIDQRLDRVDQRLDGIDQRLDRVDQRLDVLDRRFDALDLRFDAVEKRMDRFEERVKSSRNLTFAHIAISALAVIVPLLMR
jgi:chaperonin cofactor prefoldin